MSQRWASRATEGVHVGLLAEGAPVPGSGETFGLKFIKFSGKSRDFLLTQGDIDDILYIDSTTYSTSIGKGKTMKVNKKVKLRLVGLDGNAFALMGAFRKQARKEKWTPDEIQAVLDECMAGDYNHLLRVLMEHTTE